MHQGVLSVTSDEHHAMYYWIKGLREEALLVNPQAPACTTQFAPVSMAQEQQHSCGKMVVYVGSASLEIPEVLRSD